MFSAGVPFSSYCWGELRTQSQRVLDNAGHVNTFWRHLYDNPNSR